MAAVQEKVCFFRSALTPLAVFQILSELLPNDGPEAVNAATFGMYLGIRGD